eukprot:5909398-Pyramimonas_sp.AAC.1
MLVARPEVHLHASSPRKVSVTERQLVLQPLQINHIARVMLAGPKVGERWEKVGNWTQGEKKGREAMGVERTRAVIGTGGPVKRSER